MPTKRPATLFDEPEDDVAEPTKPPSRDLRAEVIEAQERLCPEYGCPIAYFHDIDPLSELVSSMLNHRTRNSEASKARRNLINHFGSWEAVRDADQAEIEPLIAMVQWPERKARSIPAALQEITRRRGNLSLEFLGELPVREARDWLESMSGVGPKTSAAVLSFSTLRGRALPVDSHHHRVVQRLGWIGPKMGPGPAHQVLEALIPEDWDAQAVYDHHEVLMLHGQQVCRPKPKCDQCVLADMCDYFRRQWEKVG